MAVLNTIASKSHGCGGDDIDTGELGCLIEFGIIKHIIGLKKGTIIPKETDLDIDYINTLIQAGKAIPIMDSFNFENTSSEDTFETSPIGLDSLSLKGLPKFTITQKQGQYYYKEMSKLTGYGNLEWIFGDINENWKVAVSPNGDYKGFDTGQTTAMMTTVATPSEVEKKSISFQLTNREEYDRRYEIFLASELFPITDVKGVNGVSLFFEDPNGSVIPADSDTTLKVKAVLTADKITPLEGLLAPSFLYKVNGVSTAVALNEDGNGFYTLTVTVIASPDVLELKLHDSGVNKNVIISNGVLFRSNLLEEIVVP